MENNSQTTSCSIICTDCPSDFFRNLQSIPGQHQPLQHLLSQAFKGSLEICAPVLLLYEIANALWKGKKFSLAKISRALETFFNSPVQLFRIDKHLAISAAKFMAHYDITFYDSMYAALADSLQIPLLTADLKGHKKIKEIEIMEL